MQAAHESWAEGGTTADLDTFYLSASPHSIHHPSNCIRDAVFFGKWKLADHFLRV